MQNTKSHSSEIKKEVMTDKLRFLTRAHSMNFWSGVEALRNTAVSKQIDLQTKIPNSKSSLLEKTQRKIAKLKFTMEVLLQEKHSNLRLVFMWNYTYLLTEYFNDKISVLETEHFQKLLS